MITHSSPQWVPVHLGCPEKDCCVPVTMAYMEDGCRVCTGTGFYSGKQWLVLDNDNEPEVPEMFNARVIAWFDVASAFQPSKEEAVAITEHYRKEGCWE
jgi:hypothetical protein